MTEKRPATASRGMVVTNHPLGSAAGAEMLAAGGNAVDAAIGALFALTVVEPMMVGIFGAGMTHLRLADGRHLVIDNYTTAPAASRPDMFKPVSDTWPDYLRAEGDVNLVGLLSVGVPGTLKAWAEALARFGRLDLETVMQPAIRHAERGFRATPYLTAAATESAIDLARFPETARTFLPGGTPIKPGDLIAMPDYAATLRLIAAKGPGVLYGGDLGATVADYMRRDGGIITLEDLARYETIERRPIRGRYRGFEITGPPPPTAGGLHLVEMLNILEAYDPRGLGFGTAEYFHLIAEVLKIGFADRNACTGDPAFVDIPVERLTSKEYAAARRAQIRPDRAGEYGATPGVAIGSAHTTHVTTADAEGNVVAMTQTINNLFGSKATVPGTGVLLNNTMALFDPHPGTPASVAPGKRVTSSMAPTIVLRDGKPAWALGLPGGVRIFTSVLQAVVNLIDHGMTLQEAVEAPRIWSQGQELEMEQDIPAAVREAVAARGHRVVAFPAVAGGMNAVAFAADGTLEGAACWRADGTPIGVSGGLARSGTRFRPDVRRSPVTPG
ncbi:MAG TPA: gamma-glutamyltransferase [Candidatus Dormibacteraeota bacterium]|nr:gamma-glutamyltransferase [Candidatus Dormibacteraeota bacterium]